MRFYKYAGILLMAVLLSNCQDGQQEAVKEETTSARYVVEGEKHLKNLKMLTEEGENAEAYYGFQEKMLTYQSKRPGSECDQIFVMNLDGSGKKMVSNGKGRTTCAYFLPGDSLVVYASTHHDADECPPPPDMSRGYVWQLYDTYDIFVSDLQGNQVAQLTDAAGYDAEATVSPKGDKIVFTSTRDGDPEIYTMNLDGSDQKRLTHARGYDGGPFFSPDGEKIVFRASRPETEKELADYDDLVELGYVRPTTLEIYVMNADGSDIQQVTSIGKASFAPFFHPDGKRIIFSSNANSESGRDFDIYLINVDGSGLEQITFNETFDGFPMFSRDGKYLVFGSNRFNKKRGDTNIFLAEWVD